MNMDHRDKMRAQIQRLTFVGLFAALAWLCFMLLKIDIVHPAGKTPIHFANAVCVLAGIMLGPLYGGLAGSIGLVLADYTAGYAHAALPTFLTKFLIGFLAGILAQKIKLGTEQQKKQVIIKTMIVSGICLLVVNVLVDPFLRYGIYRMIGIQKDLAKYLGLFNLASSALNGLISSIVLVILFPILKKAMTANGLWNRIQPLHTQQSYSHLRD